jgi:PLP dependent protein
MTTIASRLQVVRSRIDAAAVAAGRSPGDIRLIAVSKTFPPAAIAEAHAAGQIAFGENYLQEAVSKMAALGGLELEWPVASPQAGPLLRPLEWHDAQGQEDGRQRESNVRPSAGVASPQAGPLLRPLEWHFIGPIQSNKTRQIAEQFHWVHAIDRLKIAERLSISRPPNRPPLEICIQVNVSGEESKSGIRPDEVLALAKLASRLPGLRLRGLMAIPEPTPDIGLQRSRFRLLRQLRDEIVGRGVALDTLSMGMSDDLEAAIAEGATLVRVGRAIFGERPPHSG